VFEPVLRVTARDADGNVPATTAKVRLTLTTNPLPTEPGRPPRNPRIVVP
jgi:hypothetical protein